MDTVAQFCTPRQPTAHFRGHHPQTPTRNHQDNLPLAQTNLQTFTPNILPHATCLLLLWLPKILHDSDHVRTFSFTNPFPAIRKSIELSPLSVPHNSNINIPPSNSKDPTSFDKPAQPTHTNAYQHHQQHHTKIVTTSTSTRRRHTQELRQSQRIPPHQRHQLKPHPQQHPNAPTPHTKRLSSTRTNYTTSPRIRNHHQPDQHQQTSPYLTHY